MADQSEAQQQRERGAAREERARAKDASADEPTYPAERLLAESHDFFGHPEHVVAGALALRSGPEKKNYTHAEVSEAIDAFLSYAPGSEEA